MNKILLIIILLISSTLHSQISNPVKWEFTKKKISDKEYELIFTANIDDCWAIYSQFIADGGPEPTLFEFSKNSNYELVGKVKESRENRISKKDVFFENIVVSKFYKKAVFKQKIKIKNSDTTIKGGVMFMACSNNFCLAPKDVLFEFKVSS